MKKLISIILTISVATTLISCSARKEPTGSSKKDRDDEDIEETEEEQEEQEEVIETITETTEYIDPQCTDANGMVIRPNPDQYIDPEIYSLEFYYLDYRKGEWYFSLYPDDRGGVYLQAGDSDTKFISVYIDQEHAQNIYDELSKYKFYYWQPEDYQTIDENGVITSINPPYQFYIYSVQFINRDSIRLNEEDLEAFLTYCGEYFDAIYESQNN